LDLTRRQARRLAVGREGEGRQREREIKGDERRGRVRAKHGHGETYGVWEASGFLESVTLSVAYI